MLDPRHKPGGIVNTVCYVANICRWSYQLHFKFKGDVVALYDYHRSHSHYDESKYKTKNTSNTTKRRK